MQIRTPATLLGDGLARALAVGLGACAYLLTAVEVLLRVLSPWAFLVALSLPLALGLFASLFDRRGVPGNAPASAARVALVFGSLLILSQALSLGVR